METNLIAALDAYEAAQGNTDRLWLRSGDSDAAESAHQAAIAAEESAVDTAIRTLRELEPELRYPEARGMVAIPAYRAKLRAQYGG